MLKQTHGRPQDSSTFCLPLFKPLGRGFPGCRGRCSVCLCRFRGSFFSTTETRVSNRSAGRRSPSSALARELLSGQGGLSLFFFHSHGFLERERVEFFKDVFASQDCVHQTLVSLQRAARLKEAFADDATRQRLLAPSPCRSPLRPSYLILVLQNVVDGFDDEEQVLRVIRSLQEVGSARQPPHEANEADAALPAQGLAKWRHVANDGSQTIHQGRSGRRGARRGLWRHSPHRRFGFLSEALSSFLRPFISTSNTPHRKDFAQRLTVKASETTCCTTSKSRSANDPSNAGSACGYRATNGAFNATANSRSVRTLTPKTPAPQSFFASPTTSTASEALRGLTAREVQNDERASVQKPQSKRSRATLLRARTAATASLKKQQQGNQQFVRAALCAEELREGLTKHTPRRQTRNEYSAAAAGRWGSTRKKKEKREKKREKEERRRPALPPR